VWSVVERYDLNTPDSANPRSYHSHTRSLRFPLPSPTPSFPICVSLSSVSILSAITYSTSSYASLPSSYSANSLTTAFLHQSPLLSLVFGPAITGEGVVESHGGASFFGHVPVATGTSREANLNIFRGLGREEGRRRNSQLEKIDDAKLRANGHDASPSSAPSSARSSAPTSPASAPGAPTPSDILLRIKGVAKSVDKIIEGGRLVNDERWKETRKEMRERKEERRRRRRRADGGGGEGGGGAGGEEDAKRPPTPPRRSRDRAASSSSLPNLLPSALASHKKARQKTTDGTNRGARTAEKEGGAATLQVRVRAGTGKRERRPPARCVCGAMRFFVCD